MIEQEFTPTLIDILESLLFATDTPLTLDQLRNIVEQSEDQILPALDKLEKTYNFRKDAFYLAKIAGGYQLRTRPDFNSWIQRLHHSDKLFLSKASIETLSIVAYKQPIVRSEIEHFRGVDSGGVLKTLLELKLIRIVGRKEIPGRPIVYATTSKFLEHFGLASLKDLPTIQEAVDSGVPPTLPLENREIPFSEAKME